MKQARVFALSLFFRSFPAEKRQEEEEEEKNWNEKIMLPVQLDAFEID